jgi:putative ABC transport system substrate-binding protein
MQQFSELRRRDFISFLAGAVAWPLAGHAQQTTLPVVGFLSTYDPSGVQPLVAAFRKGLAEVGYVEGQNLVMENRYAEGGEERLRDLG